MEEKKYAVYDGTMCLAKDMHLPIVMIFINAYIKQHCCGKLSLTIKELD